MRAGFQVFDTHTHVGAGAHSGARCTADQLLEAMDREGIDRSLVIPFPVVEDMRSEHDQIAKAVAAHPDRLIGAAYVYPVLGQNAFRSEVKRCVEKLGFKALKVQPQYQPFNPLQDRMNYVFEIAVRFNLPVVCHTGNGIPSALPSLFMVPARKFPELKIILAHSGGGLLHGEAIVAALFCPNIYLELSTLMPCHIRHVLSQVPSSRLLIGSDLPENLTTEIDKIISLRESREARQDILWKTAARVFCGEGE